eukprot:TRINITY_DN1525_c0_g3_i1.p1 TRINITY_DN1525_c0_g3~~TRINITY_DN1525_c0_g3_i1.p1  ORF type:complete len:422 (-),score=86.72 TRINITY_DN1525_c0_g3_i1:53-1318(-)
MANIEQKEVHLLTLKVMRLSKPGFQIAAPVLCESDDIPADVLLGGSTPSSRLWGMGTEGFGLTSFLQLPTSFGILYLGETFTIYISVNNPSNIEVFAVSLKVELQTATQRIKLYDNTDTPISKFSSNESNDHVLQHEVKEGGVNILSCGVNYTKADGEKKNFRKFFRFQVMNPFSIVPKIYTLQNTIFLEASIENTTQSPIFLEFIKVEPTELFVCTDINPNTTSTPTIDNSLQLSKDIVYIKPGNSRQYLFKLTPKDPFSSDAKTATVVGRLEVVWRSTLGEVGRLQTVPLQRRIVLDDLELTLGSLPERVVLEQPFIVQCFVTNKGSKPLAPLLCVLKGSGHGIRVNGHQVKEVGTVEPNDQAVLQLEMFPVKPGMQKIGGLALHVYETPINTAVSPNNANPPRAFNFNNLADVFVHNS